ncbi:MAG: hypothetical protein A2X94_00355 [Bdellovibrionales bacterium GWB1_55_8]|nr:MAG: hypothetical protein A2X94_00355 [Bdellovibrionales bacterium GWB1_55_8]
MADTRIGISGWTYAGWRGTFYPPGLPHRKELEFASREVNSIEINGSFYSLQRPSSYKAWYAATPEDFIFSVKASRYITHLTRLTDLGEPLSNFFASGVLLLREKLGPFLWQFPPSMKYDRDRFSRFLDVLPRDTRAAAKMARRHSPWMKERAHVRAEEDRPLRHAIEIRNERFRTGDFIELLKNQDISLVIADSAGKWPQIEEITGPIVYIRLHGAEELYASGYDSASLDRWEEKIRNWRRARSRATRDVFVYFDNDAKVRAPFDAISLLKRLTKFHPLHPVELKAA